MSVALGTWNVSGFENQGSRSFGEKWEAEEIVEAREVAALFKERKEGAKSIYNNLADACTVQRCKNRLIEKYSEKVIFCAFVKGS